MKRPIRCPECARGMIRPLARPGRVRRYRTMQLEVPPDLAIPTCDSCGAQYLDRSTVDQLDDPMKNCPNCNGTSLRTEMMERSRVVGQHTFKGRVPALVCGSCGETWFTGPALLGFEHAITRRLLDAGVAEPAALAFIRKSIGLTGRELAALLDVRPETVSRWERGTRPIDRASYAVLRQMVIERIAGADQMADYLRSLEKPKKLPRRIQLDRVVRQKKSA